MKYELHVCCSRGGVCREAGVHAHYECVDDDEAKSKAEEDLRFLICCYDTVQWSLSSESGGEAIAKGAAYGYR